PTSRPPEQDPGVGGRQNGAPSWCLSCRETPPWHSLRRSPRDLPSKRRNHSGDRTASRGTRHREQLRPEGNYKVRGHFNSGHLLQRQRATTALAAAIDHDEIAVRSLALSKSVTQPHSVAHRPQSLVGNDDSDVGNIERPLIRRSGHSWY